MCSKAEVSGTGLPGARKGAPGSPTGRAEMLPIRSGRKSWRYKALCVPTQPWDPLNESNVCSPASFILNSCRNIPHQRCQSLSSAFTFKAKFLAAMPLSSSRNLNSPFRVMQGHDLFLPSFLEANQTAFQPQASFSSRQDQLHFNEPISVPGYLTSSQPLWGRKGDFQST